MTPTKEQLADPKWWDKNAPDASIAVCCANHDTNRLHRGEFIFIERFNDGSSNEGYTIDGKEFSIIDTYWDLFYRPSLWRGPEDGLPPVGMVCEWLSGEYGWLGGKVVGHDGSTTIVSHNDGYTGCHKHELRLIRTTEQIAADERERAIHEMGCIYSRKGGHIGGLVALYDAGYRKQVK